MVVKARAGSLLRRPTVERVTKDSRQCWHVICKSRVACKARRVKASQDVLSRKLFRTRKGTRSRGRDDLPPSTFSHPHRPPEMEIGGGHATRAHADAGR